MRLFLAIAVPGEIQDRIAAAVGALRARHEGWRWTRPGPLHLTLRFLGDVDPDRDRRSRESWSRAASAVAPSRLRAGGLGVFPSRSRARVLWVGIEEARSGSTLVSLVGEIEQAAQRLGWPEEGRPFHPHVTIARAAGWRRPSVPDAVEIGELGEFDATSLQLYRSELSAGGARHDLLAVFPFAGAGDP